MWTQTGPNWVLMPGLRVHVLPSLLSTKRRQVSFLLRTSCHAGTWSFAKKTSVNKMHFPNAGREYIFPVLNFVICIQILHRLDFKKLLRAEREARNEFFCGLRENLSMRGPTRPDPTQPNPTQPDPVTLLRSLYLRNWLTDSRAVFFARCHHSLFNKFRI